MNKKRKLPPYAKSIRPDQPIIVVFTGSDGWSRSGATTWMQNVIKTLLPYGDDPEAYKWNFVCGKDVLIKSLGTPETYNRLIELSRCLLAHGATVVKWWMPEYFTDIKHFIGKGARC